MLDKFLEINSIIVAISGGGVFSIILGSMKVVMKKSRDTDDRLKTHDAALIAILHDKLYTKCNEYITRGYATVDEINNLRYLYDSYHDLGGNGTGTKLYERVINLPTKQEVQEND